MSTRIGCIASWLLMALLVSHATAQTPAQAETGVLPNPTGFLPDYTQLKAIPGKEGRYGWSTPDSRLRNYTSLILAPLSIWIDPQALSRGLSADVVARLATIYQSAFTKVLSPEFPVVDKPGPAVALCRFALTDVTPQSPLFRARDAVPVIATFNLVRAATGTSAKVARISAEFYCQDSVTDVLLLEAVITGVGTQRFIEGEPITWPEVEPVLAGWAQDFKNHLIEAQQTAVTGTVPLDPGESMMTQVMMKRIPESVPSEAPALKTQYPDKAALLADLQAIHPGLAVELDGERVWEGFGPAIKFRKNPDGSISRT